MAIYNCPATIIADGNEISVEASLGSSHDGTFRSWEGSVEATEDGEDFYDVMISDDVKIRMPDGREGVVVPTYTSVGSGRLDVTGSGPAPF
ncbi:hypothetical protein ACFWR9_11650 [Streptomyces sp. NPDC058534]|uniref:hypothetical protein n=1 Tax=Streptomyces sp. NPDC058534 TaxID=3346541 RepID=UPI003665FF99